MPRPAALKGKRCKPLLFQAADFLAFAGRSPRGRGSGSSQGLDRPGLDLFEPASGLAASLSAERAGDHHERSAIDMASQVLQRAGVAGGVGSDKRRIKAEVKACEA